jgi:hypothetical protein
MHARCREAIAQAVGNFIVEKRQKAIAAVNERDVDAERFENGSVFSSDDPAADDRETFGDAVHLQESV